MTKERNTNVELIRIMAIIMVIYLHAIYYGKVGESVPKDSINYIVFSVAKACISVCVNLFILITGYFGIDKDFKIKKYVKSGSLYCSILY